MKKCAFNLIIHFCSIEETFTTHLHCQVLAAINTVCFDNAFGRSI